MADDNFQKVLSKQAANYIHYMLLFVHNCTKELTPSELNLISP